MHHLVASIKLRRLSQHGASKDAPYQAARFAKRGAYCCLICRLLNGESSNRLSEVKFERENNKAGKKMIANTVFVIGAGASCELGMPAGQALKDQIEKLLTFKAARFGELEAGSRKIHQEMKRLLSEKSIDDEKWKKFFTAATVVANGLHHAPSIDNFLNAHASNKELVTMGKMAIVEAILEAEETALAKFFNANTGRIETRKLKSTWYKSLFEILVQGVSKENIQNVFSDITFIVFNYDRAVELIFPYFLAEHYDVDLRAAIAAFNSAKVIHPYGKIGELLNPTQHLVRGFGYAPKSLYELAKEINTFTEGEKDAELVTDIDGAISEARTIVFLGYGFIDINNKILMRATIKKVKRIFSTTKGLSPSDANSVASFLATGFRETTADGKRLFDPRNSGLYNPLDDNIFHKNMTCSEFFVEFRLSLNVPPT